MASSRAEGTGRFEWRLFDEIDLYVNSNRGVEIIKLYWASPIVFVVMLAGVELGMKFADFESSFR